ncbi:hypothetical protein VCRA2123E76_70034 [Vibrio crassostreae]|nr:hypothetical protein VCRA2123E76_70034 [Vibrio crassostreae]
MHYRDPFIIKGFSNFAIKLLAAFVTDGIKKQNFYREDNQTWYAPLGQIAIHE